MFSYPMMSCKLKVSCLMVEMSVQQLSMRMMMMKKMPGTGIRWTVIGEAMGASEQLELRRSSRIRELYAEEEFDSEEEEFDNEDGLDGMDEDE